MNLTLEQIAKLTGAELKGPDQAILGNRPAFRQSRNDVTAFVRFYQGVVKTFDDHEGQRTRGEMGIQRIGIPLEAKNDGSVFCLGRGIAASGTRQSQNRNQNHHKDGDFLQILHKPFLASISFVSIF